MHRMLQTILLLLLLPLLGCGGGDNSETQAALVTYIDKDSGEVIQAPSQPVPGKNPKTGTQTLLLAGWCDQCKKWSPLPPNTNPGTVNCKVHKSPLTLNGPTPTATSEGAK